MQVPDRPDVQQSLFDCDVQVPIGRRQLSGRLTVPEDCRGFVMLTDGRGDGLTSRNGLFVSALNRAGLGTFLVDLLGDDDELDRRSMPDLQRLAYRFIDLTEWLSDRPETGDLGLCYLGAGADAPVVLWAAADPRVDIIAVVTCGERPDLSAPRLAWLRVPTLLIVGSRDHGIIECNHRALAQLHCDALMVTVPNATHLFEEPGSLESVVELARDWFVDHL